MKWFTKTFLPSFKIGETKITEKQFFIFTKYLKERIENDYTEEYRGIVEDKKICAYVWDSVAGTQYFVRIQEANK